MRDFDSIREKIKEDPQNFEGYRELGDYYLKERHNVNQAFLCYEQAYALCEDSAAGEDLQQLMEGCREGAGFEVQPVSFVILSYNAKDMMIDCLESIRKGCVPGSYEIVVVDNASEDGIRDYLIEQKDIILQLNDHNTSFSEGCNQGVRLAAHKNDIMLLNNDTIVPPFAMFYLRLGLYETNNIGAAGPMTNYAMDRLRDRRPPGIFSSKEEWIENARNIHLPSLQALENKVWLVGFALLIKRKSWNHIGTLDEQFLGGCYEDIDYGLRLCANGHRCVLCHNAFIYHYGNVSFGKDPTVYNQLLKNNEECLYQKVGFHYERYDNSQIELVSMMGLPSGERMAVLEVGSGFGLALSAITYKYPGSYAVGIEKNPIVAKIGHTVANVMCADIETEILTFEEESFDYILCPQGLNVFENVREVMNRLRNYLKPTGKLLVLQRNLLSGWNLMALLSGEFETAVERDEDARHLYTKNETIQLLSEVGLKSVFIMKYTTGYMEDHPQEREVLKEISRLPGVAIAGDFQTASYIITSVRQ